MIFSINKIVENRVILIAGTIKKQTKELNLVSSELFIIQKLRNKNEK